MRVNKNYRLSCAAITLEPSSYRNKILLSSSAKLHYKS